MVLVNMSFSSALPFPSSTSSSNLYSRLPTSPTSSISSIDSAGSGMSCDSEAESSRMGAGRARASSSFSTDGSFDEKRFPGQGNEHGRDIESLSDDDNEHDHDGEYEPESRSLLGVLPIPASVRLPKKWRSMLQISALSRDHTSDRSQRRIHRKKGKSSLIPKVGIVLLSLVVGVGYLLIDSTSLYSTTVDGEYDYDLEQLVDPSSSAVPEWVKAVRTINDDTTHVLIPPHSPSSNVRLLQPLRNRLPYPVLDEYFSTGRLPSDVHGGSRLSAYEPRLDLVYLFVNASSPYLERAMLDRAELEGVFTKGKKRHWRDNGELRGAVRSAVKHLGKSVGNVHLVSADWGMREQDLYLLGDDSSSNVDPDAEIEQGGWRIGQIPEWLDWESQTAQNEDGASRLQWHFHNDIFRLPSTDNGVSPARDTSLEEGDNVRVRQYWEDGVEQEMDVDVTVNWETEEEWKDLALPSFNSFAIESRLSWVDGLSENLPTSSIAFNDDMFVLRNLSAADFRHPLLGNLVRLDAGLLVGPIVQPEQISDPGEWGALNHANSLLSLRFPERKRMYMHHIPKTVSRALVDEASIIFADELSLATTRGFRESLRGEGDVEMAWLTTHLRIERWREALLWSWAVAKVGGEDGQWGADARQELRSAFGMKDEEGDEMRKIFATRGPRKTLEDLNAINKQAGWEGPKASTYHFSSMDGHLPAQPDQEGLVENAQCTFRFSDCLPADFFAQPDTLHSASDMFAHLAFARPQCGDCLITSLVRKSGERGIEAFLPYYDQVYRPTSKEGEWERSEPILPLVHDWREADFTLEANVKSGQDVWEGTGRQKDGAVELRKWCTKLLSRYTYVYGGTPSLFAPIHSASQVLDTLARIDAEPELTLFCMNDDQVDATSARALRARRRFGEWMEARFGDEQVTVGWERHGVQWFDPSVEMVDVEDRNDWDLLDLEGAPEGDSGTSTVGEDAGEGLMRREAVDAEWIEWEQAGEDATW